MKVHSSNLRGVSCAASISISSTKATGALRWTKGLRPVSKRRDALTFDTTCKAGNIGEMLFVGIGQCGRRKVRR